MGMTAASLIASNIVLGSDYYDVQPRMMTANYGFQGYMGIIGLNGTDQTNREVAYLNKVSWGRLTNRRL